MKTRFFNVMDELLKDPDFLHNREKQIMWLKNNIKEPWKYSDMVMRYTYFCKGDRERCRYCDVEDLSYDWDYCPYCGAEIEECDVDITDKDVDTVKKQYKVITGHIMPDEEVDKIKAVPMLMVCFD